MKKQLLLPVVFLLLGASRLPAEEPGSSAVKIRQKAAASRAERSARDEAVHPDTEIIDAPTTAVLDNYGYSSRSRFYARGGLLQHLSFGVYPGINLGASAAVDGLIGDERTTRMRSPTAQVKWRFYEGDNELPSFAVGFDGQGYRYNSGDRRFNQRQRGFYCAATKELGAPGVQLHPSFNISDFDSNGIFGSLPLTVNFRDKAAVLVEWDNINNWIDSRFNAGLRAYLTGNFYVDFAVRSIGAGGSYSDGAPRGPERVVQLKYSNSF
ncbi:MAG: hypothetical protein HY403_06005 [Elusimicrobia bacterium]|nr:hypothetical protein [Elusimicrobiota bacterium]